uniref:Uncharacterized protein n=1 Tax=Timema poppense TaxID=170557 RepID=A0A7R9CLW6_TIMPO|nr:unnamed protein product [Timema poppensis]
MKVKARCETWPFSFQQPTQQQHQSQRVGSSAEWSGSSDTNLQPHLKDSSSSCDLEEDHHGFHRHQNNIHYSDSFLHVP